MYPLPPIVQTAEPQSRGWAASCLLVAEFPLLTGSPWDLIHLCDPLSEWHLVGLPKADKEERGGKTPDTVL